MEIPKPQFFHRKGMQVNITNKLCTSMKKMFVKFINISVKIEVDL